MNLLIAPHSKEKFLIVGIFVFLFFCLSLFVGSDGFSFPINWENNFSLIFRYRLERSFLALIAGSSLAASGASLQALFKNPIADPHLFGISGGGALGACLVIAFFSENFSLLPSIGAIAGGSLSFLIIFFYQRKFSHHPVSYCLLVGILINSLSAALITLLKTTLPAQKAQSLLFWLVGNISLVNEQSWALIIPLWIFGLWLLLSLRGELEIISFGQDEAKLLGIDARRLTQKTIVANCILIGNTVAFTGMIGFVGLVVPHLVRLSFSPDLRLLMPYSALLGALSLILFDCVSRYGFSIFGTEIQVGAISSIFLAPIFFILLFRDFHDSNSLH